MKRLSRLIAFLLLFALCLPAQAQADVTVRLPSPTVRVGDTFDLDAEIDCATGCSVFAIMLAFDPDVVQVDTVEIGMYLGRSLVIDDAVDNERGTVSLAAVALGEILPDDENTILFTLSLTAQAPGSVQLRARQLDVGDLNANPLTVSFRGGLIQVDAAATATPTRRPTPAFTPTPRVTGSCGNGLAWQFLVGDTGRVTITETTPSTLREQPGGRRIGQIDSGMRFIVLDGPRCTLSNGVSWWYVERADGARGWVSEGNYGAYWIEPILPPNPDQIG